MKLVGEDFFSTLAVGDGIAFVFTRFCMYEQLETLDSLISNLHFQRDQLEYNKVCAWTPSAAPLIKPNYLKLLIRCVIYNNCSLSSLING